MLRTFLVVFLTLISLAAAPVAAQDSRIEAPDYDAWQQFADELEAEISDDDITNDQLTAAREDIVVWREQFNAAQHINADRIDGVNQQINALGPAPKEGETENQDIATRRTELNEQLSQLQAPQLAAVEATSRANSLIDQIERIRGKRQAAELARLAPSPLLPESWRAAASEGLTFFEGVLSEAEPRQDARTWENLARTLPVTAAYLIAAILLLTMGRRWVGSLPTRLWARTSEHSRAVVVFVTSLGQIVIPMIGTYLAIMAIKSTGLPGEWTTPILGAIPAAAVILFGGGWLGRQLFPRHAIAYDTIQMEERARNRARNMTDTLSIVFAIHHVLAAAVLPVSGLYQEASANRPRVPMSFDEGAASVWHFVLIVIAAVTLYRLGNVLRRLTRRDDAASLSYRHHILSWAGGLTRIVAVLALTLSAIGYINLGNMLTWPWILSIALIGVLVVLQDFIADFFNMLKQGKEGAREGLAPLLTGFALILLSIPLFLVIWGAQKTDLAEYWNRFESGVSFGGIHLSPGSVLTFLFIFAIGYAATRAVQGAFRTSILPKTKLDSGGQNAVVSGLGYVGIVLAAMLAITSAGIDLSSLAIVAGALSVGIGFGMQNIVSNFVSGIILLIERPVSVGDWISAGGQQGIVKRISVRSTQVETFDKTEVIVPNSDLISQPVVNWTRHNQTGRIIIPVNVAYGSDTRKVERILREIIEDQPIVTLDPAPSVLFRGFGVDALNFEIRAVLSDVTAGLGVTSEVCHQVVERFAEEGVEIPFAQRDIWLRNPETLFPDQHARPALPDAKEPHEKASQQAGKNDPRIAFDDPADGDPFDGDSDADGDGDR
jgi:potassium efflux system protein